MKPSKVSFADFLEKLEKKHLTFEAAGIIPRAKDTGRYLFAKRSNGVKMPGTWAGFGGEVDPGETPDKAARRELREESAYYGRVRPRLVYVHDNKKGFKYYNFIGEVDEEFEPDLNWENLDYEWVEPGAWPKPLHPGIIDMLNHVDLD